MKMGSGRGQNMVEGNPKKRRETFRTVRTGVAYIALALSLATLVGSLAAIPSTLPWTGKGASPWLLPVATLLSLVAAIILAGIVREKALAEARQEAIRNMKGPPANIVVESLSARISQLGHASVAIYWTIIVVILGGVALVIFSGYLSALDSIGNNLLSRLDSEATEIRSASDRSARQWAQIRAYASPSQNDDRQFLLAFRESQGPFEEQLKATYEQKRAVISAMSNRLGEGGGGSYVNVTGSVLRVCIIGLVIFLVQILVQLYRYNSRLIAFYSSRRDALLMSGGDFPKLDSLSTLLTPTGLDFGRAPSHPLGEISGFFSGRGGRRSAGEERETPGA